MSESGKDIQTLMGIPMVENPELKNPVILFGDLGKYRQRLPITAEVLELRRIIQDIIDRCRAGDDSIVLDDLIDRADAACHNFDAIAGNPDAPKPQGGD